jgi:hypothetical protein
MTIANYIVQHIYRAHIGKGIITVHRGARGDVISAIGAPLVIIHAHVNTSM